MPWGYDIISTVGDTMNTLEGILYCGGIPSSTLEDVQYCGGYSIGGK